MRRLQCTAIASGLFLRILAVRASSSAVSVPVSTWSVSSSQSLPQSCIAASGTGIPSKPATVSSRCTVQPAPASLTVSKIIPAKVWWAAMRAPLSAGTRTEYGPAFPPGTRTVHTSQWPAASTCTEARCPETLWRASAGYDVWLNHFSCHGGSCRVPVVPGSAAATRPLLSERVLPCRLASAGLGQRQFGQPPPGLDGPVWLHTIPLEHP